MAAHISTWFECPWVPVPCHYISQAALAPLLPEAVVAHDAELEDAPLADYGLIAPHHDIQVNGVCGACMCREK